MPKRKSEGIFNFNEQVEEKRKPNKKRTKIAHKNNKNNKAEEHFIGTKELPPINKKRIEKIKKEKIKEKKTKEKEIAKLEKKQAKLRKKRKNNLKKAKLTEKQIKRNKKIKFFIKMLILLLVLLGLFVYLMLSPIFNIKNINVEGNSKISTEQIISISGIKKDVNMFKISNRDTKNVIKQNPYIDKVEIKRKIPDTISIVVTERQASFMLEHGSSFAYIDSQGYILEISAETLENKIKINGYKTEEENITPGKRLCEEDLERLNDVLKIISAAENVGIENLITSINVENKYEYSLYLDSEQKNVYIGDSTNLDTKMLYVKVILEKEKENAGEIFVNMDLNQKNPFFREKV